MNSLPSEPHDDRVTHLGIRGNQLKTHRSEPDIADMVTQTDKGLFRRSARDSFDDGSRKDTRARLEERRAIWPKEDPLTT